MKSLCINFTKCVQALYAENYKTLIKEMKENLNKWRDILCSRTRRLILLRCQFYPNGV